MPNGRPWMCTIPSSVGCFLDSGGAARFRQVLKELFRSEAHRRHRNVQHLQPPAPQALPQTGRSHCTLLVVARPSRCARRSSSNGLCRAVPLRQDSTGADARMYTTPWFMTVFFTSLPWTTVVRIWDAFFCEGTVVKARRSAETIANLVTTKWLPPLLAYRQEGAAPVRTGHNEGV